METDTINIVGRGIGMELAPEDNCWGINSIIFERKVDIHFDMHSEGLLKPHQKERREKVIEITKDLNIPVYACEAIPNTTYIRYPIEEVIKEFQTGYFSNGICYMIALGLIKGIKHFNFFGVNHSRISLLDEYSLQKPGVDYWLGIIRGRGATYTVHGAMAEIGKTFYNKAYGYFLSQESMIRQYG